MKTQDASLKALLAPLKPHLYGVAAFSLCINILMLSPAIYMLQVFDRAVSSSSESTLLMLTLILVFLLSAMGLLEWVRGQLFLQAAGRLNELLGDRAFTASFRRALVSGDGKSINSLPLQDLGTLRNYLANNGPAPFFDAPWVPLYILVMFLFHWSFGLLGLVSALGLFALSWFNHRSSRQATARANVETKLGQHFCDQNLRNAEVVAAMGMMPAVKAHWQRHNNAGVAYQGLAGQVSGRFTALTKALRILLQSLALGLGAWLAINGAITPGMMIAGSILLGRALAPVDQLVGGWRQFQLARASYGRLEEILAGKPEAPPRTSLPPPMGELILDGVTAIPPRGRTPALKSVSFRLAPGTLAGVIGPSAAGKSSLARVVLGVWPTVAGSVRLDGAEIKQWNPDELGQYVGYLPQDIELFEGTVAQNIARFGEVDSDRVVEAARFAKVHAMILRLPDGYETVIGADGGALASGQRQRIALARAFYRQPKLIVLDEPDAHLDDTGEIALRRALANARDWGATILVITHRPRLLLGLDRVIVMQDGTLVDQGEAREILKKYQQPAVPAGDAAPAGGDAG